MFTTSSLELTKIIKTSLESVVEQVQDTVPEWKVSRSPGVKLELYDNVHSLPKYAALIHSCLEFTVAVYNLPVKEKHLIYKELKRSVMYYSMSELLSSNEKSSLCQGFPDDFDVVSVVVDPTSKVTAPGTILRHFLPKTLTFEKTHIKTPAVHRSKECEVIGHANLKEQQCKSCCSANTAIRKAGRRKSRASEALAKDKAQLTACGPAKLRVTVKTECLHSKYLEKRFQNLENTIKDDGVQVHEAIYR